MRAQASPEGTGGAPRALAAMGDEAAVIWRTLPANRLLYRVDRDLLGDAPGHRPAHDLAGEGACRGREIGPPFSRGHAREPSRRAFSSTVTALRPLIWAQPVNPGRMSFAP